VSLVVLDQPRKPDEFCEPCGLYKTCNSPIMEGEGSQNPVWLFIGEAPGAEEDEDGRPFIGESGLLLRETLEALGFPLQKCRFTNVVRCRPPDNSLERYPKAIEHCRPHVLREVRATNPKVVVLLGNSAIRSILNKTGILRLHGEAIEAGSRTFVCCFHPAYLLRNDTPATRRTFRQALQFAKRLGEKKPKTEKLRKHEYIRDRKMLQEYTDYIRTKSSVATDLEGSTLSPFARNRKPEIGCVGFAWSADEGVCYPVQGRNRVKISVSPEEVLEAVQDIWEDENLKHVAHFGKYDFVYAAVLHDIWLGGKRGFQGYYADTGMMSYTLNEERGAHGLKEWAWRIGMADYDLKKRQYCLANPQHDPERGGNLIYVPADILFSYNIDDCIACFRLFELLKKRLEKKGLWEHPFRFPIMWNNWMSAMIEIQGVNISWKRNRQLLDIFESRIQKEDKKLHAYPEVRDLKQMRDLELMERLYQRVKKYKRPPVSIKGKVLELYERHKKKNPINLNSTDNKRDLLYDVLGYAPPWYTKKLNQPSVEKAAIEEVYRKHPNKVLRSLIRRSGFVSSVDKYIGPIPEWIGTDGRTHSHYNPAGTVTGRVSSEDPNHENLPKRGELASELRSQFVARGEKYGMLEQDQKQVEMRLFCDRAGDDVMREEFEQGKDPHRMGAAAGFEISEKEVTKEQRTEAKSAVSFGLLYGRQAPALAADFRKSVKWAERFISNYFGKYDDCLEYRLEQERYIKKHGEVVSHFHRYRRLRSLLETGEEAKIAQAVREGINAPIQGDASDITWVAGNRFHRWLVKHKMKSRVVIINQDAVIVDYYKPELADVLENLWRFMTDRKFIEKMVGWHCTVRLDTDALIGPNLGAMQELEHGHSPGEFLLPKVVS